MHEKMSWWLQFYLQPSPLLSQSLASALAHFFLLTYTQQRQSKCNTFVFCFHFFRVESIGSEK